MLQAAEQGKTGTITFRVPDCAVLEDIAYAIITPSGTTLRSGTLSDPYQAEVDAQADSGDYRELTMDDDVFAVDASLRGQRIRCIMDFGPPVEALVEATDDTADKLYVRIPPRSGDVVSVVLPVLSLDLLATDTATLGDGYRVEWTYEADSVDCTATTMFAVVRRVVPSLTWAEVLDRDPTMRLWVEGRDSADYRAILEAARERVDTEMANHGQRIYCIAERDQLAPLFVHAVRVVSAEAGIMPAQFAQQDPSGYLLSLQRDFARLAKQVLQNAYLAEPTEDNQPTTRAYRCLRGTR